MSIFQINARTELALRYNDISPLENHHCAVAFEILEKVRKKRHRSKLYLHECRDTHDFELELKIKGFSVFSFRQRATSSGISLWISTSGSGRESSSEIITVILPSVRVVSF